MGEASASDAIQRARTTLAYVPYAIIGIRLLLLVNTCERGERHRGIRLPTRRNVRPGVPGDRPDRSCTAGEAVKTQRDARPAAVRSGAGRPGMGHSPGRRR